MHVSAMSGGGGVAAAAAAAAAARDGTQPADERLLGGRRADLLDSQLTTAFRVYANSPPRA